MPFIVVFATDTVLTVEGPEPAAPGSEPVAGPTLLLAAPPRSVGAVPGRKAEHEAVTSTRAATAPDQKQRATRI